MRDIYPVMYDIHPNDFGSEPSKMDLYMVEIEGSANNICIFCGGVFVLKFPMVQVCVGSSRISYLLKT